MAGVAKQIIGSFEDIGKDIAHEVAKVPVDIAGKALESLGTSSQKGQKGNQMNPTGDATKKPEGALAQLDQTTDQKIKQSIAREALAGATCTGRSTKERSTQKTAVHADDAAGCCFFQTETRKSLRSKTKKDRDRK